MILFKQRHTIAYTYDTEVFLLFDRLIDVYFCNVCIISFCWKQDIYIQWRKEHAIAVRAVPSILRLWRRQIMITDKLHCA